MGIDRVLIERKTFAIQTPLVYRQMLLGSDIVNLDLLSHMTGIDKDFFGNSSLGRIIKRGETAEMIICPLQAFSLVHYIFDYSLILSN